LPRPGVGPTPAQATELKSAVERLGHLVADPFETLHVGKPIMVRFGALDRWSAETGAVVPFFLEGRGGSNYDAEYVAYFQDVAYAENIKKGAIKSPGQRGKQFSLVDFAQVGGRM